MSKATELVNRVIDRMGERKIPVTNNGNMYERSDFDDLSIGEKFVRVYETGRHNGTEENVTVTIYCLIKITEHSMRRVKQIKVPKDASEKVIDKRLNEVEAFLND